MIKLPQASCLDLGVPWPAEVRLALLALTLFDRRQLLCIHQAHQTVLGIVHADIKGHFTETLDVRPGLSLRLADFIAFTVT